MDDLAPRQRALLDFIAAYQQRFKVALRPGLPRFCGGLAGYFGYDTVRYIEKKLEKSCPPDTLHCPDILLLQHGYTSIQFLGDGSGVEPVEIMPLAQADRHQCDSADVNADGLVDIYCSVGAHQGTGTGLNSLWLRRPDGGYTDVAADWGVTDPYGRGRYVTFVQADNDGLPDLFVGNYPPRTDQHISANHLFINNGGAGFTPVRGGQRDPQARRSARHRGRPDRRHEEPGSGEPLRDVHRLVGCPDHERLDRGLRWQQPPAPRRESLAQARH